ncbi:MAG: urease accessory UreF family protein [Pseudomonadota bacterium]
MASMSGAEGVGAPPSLETVLRLQAWLSPSYPLGAYSFSAGLETAAAERLVRGGSGLRDWIETTLAHGAGWSDAVFLAGAWRAARGADAAALAEVAALAAAFAPNQERASETQALGAAFLKVSAAAHPWPAPIAGAPFAAAAQAALGPAPAYPVALGVWAAAFGAPAALTVGLFLQSVAANLISAAARLSLTGQTEGQTILSALGPRIAALADAAAAAPLEAAGGATLIGDIAGMRHETQEVRLFQS